MRESIIILICVIIVIIALQTGLIRTGLDYETIKQQNSNLTEVNEQLSQQIKEITEGQQDEKKIESMNELKKELTISLKNYLESKEVVINQINGMPAVEIFSGVLFKADSKEITKNGKNILVRLAVTLAKFPEYAVEVAGFTHTAEIPKPWSKEVTNHWDYSSQQANQVIRWMIEEGDIEVHRLISVGHAYTRPRVKNNTTFNRQQNQFVQIKLRAVGEGTLIKSRQLLENEKLPEFKSEAKVSKVSKERKNTGPSGKVVFEKQEALGEDALKEIDERSFETGYELPEQIENEE